MKPHRTVLLVDDENAFRENVGEHLEKQGFKILHAGDGKSALEQVRNNLVDVALVDTFMPDIDGITLLPRLKDLDPLMEVVVIASQTSVKSAVQAMRRGAYHYVTKPVKLKELESVLLQAVEKTRLARQNRLYREDKRHRRMQAATEIVAHSPAMKRIVEIAERVAQTDSTVLIEGETGTGKEVIAEFIHRKSYRKDETLSVLTCGSLSETLLDDELFGHEKGAYTGAATSRPGIIEVADGGTLLLDEIGDIPPSAQMRLLRFLERGVFRRVGSTREQAVDVRILAATNRDLEQEVTQGRFRMDLFHRLLVFRLRLPPLRERTEDIIPLAECFLSSLAGPGCPAPALSEGARAALLAHSWPGNVRELAHTIERAVFSVQMADTDEIEPAAHLRLPVWQKREGLLVTLKEAERRHVLAVLDHFGNNRQKAAEVLGVSERHLYRLIRQFNQGTEQGPARPGSLSPNPDTYVRHT